MLSNHPVFNLEPPFPNIPLIPLYYQVDPRYIRKNVIIKRPIPINLPERNLPNLNRERFILAACISN